MTKHQNKAPDLQMISHMNDTCGMCQFKKSQGEFSVYAGGTNIGLSCKVLSRKTVTQYSKNRLNILTPPI